MEGVDADGLGPAPSIDVNDNRETRKLRVRVPDDARAARPGSGPTPGIKNRLDLKPDCVFPVAEIINGFPEQQEVDVGCPDGGRSEPNAVTGSKCAGKSVDKPNEGCLNAQLDSPDVKMRNGDAVYRPGHRLDYARAMQGVKVGNGGLLIVNSYNTLSQVPFGSLGGPASRKTDSGCERMEHSEETSCDPDTLSDLSAKLSSSPLAENTSDYTEAEPSPDEEFTEGGPPARPRTLRTRSAHPVSLSCDATPLSPGDDGYFGVGDEGSVNAFEGGRRQSAPDTANPEASSDPTGDAKRRGIAEFLTRYMAFRVGNQ